MASTPELTCYACGATASPPAQRCACGEPLWFDTDPTGFTWPEGTPGEGLWRYADRLPVDPPAGIGAGAGGTPLIRAERLDERAGCRLWIKSEAGGVTGSFKDRGSAVGVAWADAAGDGRVGTVSHGNMAMSMAAHAAAHGLDCVVLVPADIPTGRLERIAAFDPSIVRVDGAYGELYYDALELGPDAGIAFVNSDSPLRVAGQKTVAFEVMEAFAPEVPDAVVLPVSSGGHASAVWRACRELERAGLIDAIPPLYLVQAAACDPIARAAREGHGSVSAIEAGETIAYSIANPDPPSGNRALAAARATGGDVLAVDDAAMRTATRALADRTGLSVEPACAAALAGTEELTAAGRLDATDDVVMIATGTGLKEPLATEVTAPTIARDELATALPAVIGA